MSDNKPNTKKALEDAYAFIDGMDPDSEAYREALRSIKELEQIQDSPSPPRHSDSSPRSASETRKPRTPQGF